MIAQFDRWLGVIILLAGLSVSAPALAAPPKPAPAAYATPNYGLTFAVPPGLSYCPLPADWVGSDHGKTLFLKPPKSCDGSEFSPRNTPRIEVYYAWWFQDDPVQPCRRPRGRMRLLGNTTPMCQVRRDGLVGVELHTHYPLSSSDGEAIVTLLTTRQALPHDLALFERLAESVRTCIPAGAETGFGSGAPCPTA